MPLQPFSPGVADDHSDVPAFATPFVVGAPVAGIMNGPDDEDWFSVDLVAGLPYRLTLDWEGDGHYSTLQIFRPDLTRLAFATPIGVTLDPIMAAFVADESGAHVIGLRTRYGGQSDAAYTLRVEIEPDETADAGTTAFAPFINLIYNDGPSYHGVLETGSDVDWIRTDFVGRGGIGEVRVRADGPILMTVRNAEGEMVARGVGNVLPAGTLLRILPLTQPPGEEFFVEVRARDGDRPIAYTVDVGYDDNIGGPGDAIVTSILREGAPFRDGFFPITDSWARPDTDWFNFRAFDAGPYVVAVEGINPALVDYVAVIDRDGREIARATDGPLVFEAAYAGEHLIEVAGFAQSAGLEYAVRAEAVGRAPLRTLTVFASGTGDAGDGPAFRVLVDGVEVGEGRVAEPGTNAERRAGTLEAEAFEFQWRAEEEPEAVTVEFVNDGRSPSGENRNLVVDAVVVEGLRYESEIDGLRTRFTGPIEALGADTLFHAGAMAFDVSQPPQALQSVTVIGGGTGDGGVGPTFRVLADDVEIGRGAIAAPGTNAERRMDALAMESFVFEYLAAQGPDRLVVEFLDDGRGPGGENINLVIDAVIVNGDRIETELAAERIRFTGQIDPFGADTLFHAGAMVFDGLLTG